MARLGPWALVHDNTSFPEPVWVFLDREGWLYLNEDLTKLLWVVLTQWRQDQHLAGY